MEKKNLSISQWASCDRPRTKMMNLGVNALTDAELLAILVGTGTKEESAVEMMRRVLCACNNNLNTLGKMDVEELCSFNGVGQAKALTILAACELGKRRNLHDVQERIRMQTSQDIYNFMHPRMQDLQGEECWIILLNASLKVIDSLCISRGGLSSTLVDVRVVLREAIVKRSSLLILCHNHPSGSIRPSREDDLLTSRMQKACQTVNIPILDHVIVTDGGYYSYNDEGRL